MGEIQVLLVWLLCLCSIVFGGIILCRKQRNVHRGPPSPPSLPIIGHLHLISQLPHQTFHNLSLRYGPIMQIFLGSVPCVVVSSPEIVREFIKTHEFSFSNRFQSAAIHQISYGSKGFLFAPYGSYWKFMRKLCMSQLLGGRILDQFLPLRQQETLRFIRFLHKKGEAGEAINVGDELLSLTSNVISRMIMRTSYCENDGDHEEDIRKMVAETAELGGKFNISDFIWFCNNLDFQGLNKRLKKILDKFDSMMERVIKEHEEKRKERGEEEVAQIRDLLDILLQIHQDDDDNNQIKLTRDNIKAFVLEIFLAGSDTSAITMEWALAELINHPQVMEKAREEIDSVTGNSSRLIQESDLSNLPFLQAIVKETLRIHPTFPLLVRESSQSCNVCGYEIPEKSILFVNLWSMGKDPNLWDNPLEFRPERFISEEQNNNKFDVRGQNFQLMPFGSGRRVCPGASLALQVVTINLAAMIQCFEWKVNGTLNMEEKTSHDTSKSSTFDLCPYTSLSSNSFHCMYRYLTKGN